MSIIHAELRLYLRRVLIFQVSAVSAITIATAFWKGTAAAGAVAYGGAIALAGTLVLMVYARRAERTGSNLAVNAGLIYGSAITRLATAFALFAAGIAILRLPPLPLMLGFIAGLAAQLISTAFDSGKKTWRAKR